MKIGITADFHLGIKRFYNDAFKNAENALKLCEKNADVIIVAGDIFDNRNPSYEVIKKTLDMFKNIKKPIIIIYGNHDRPIKGYVGALEILNILDHVYLLQNSRIEIMGQNFFGIGYVPEEYAKIVLEKINVEEKDILIMHQGIKEYSPNSEINLEDIKNTNVKKVICGHIHQRRAKDKLIIPGSTIPTQLKKEEMGEKSITIYDTNKEVINIIPIPSRRFIFKEIDISNKGINEINETIKNEIKTIKKSDEIIKLKLKGNLKVGIKKEDLVIKESEDIFIDIESEENQEIIEIQDIDAQKSIKEEAINELVNKLKDKVSFNVREIFEKAKESKLTLEDFKI